MIRLVEALFVNDPDSAVLLARNMDKGDLEDIRFRVTLEPDEEIVVCFSAAFKKPRKWFVLLTDRRIIFKNITGRGMVGVYYPQIAKLSRSFGSLIIITSHADQTIQLNVPNPFQTQWLKTGIEKLLAEIAFDPSKIASPAKT